MRPGVHGTLDLLEREKELSALDAASTRGRAPVRRRFAPALDRETAEVV
jgi:hypothetical protein